MSPPTSTREFLIRLALLCYIVASFLDKEIARPLQVIASVFMTAEITWLFLILAGKVKE